VSDVSVDPMHTLAAMRSAFDESFAAPARSPGAQDPVIQVRVGGEVFAIRTGHIGGLVKSRKIVPLPSRMPELLGVAALRGSLIPVYDLATLLGVPTGAIPPVWLVLAPGDSPVGLAFQGFEGQHVPEWLCEQSGAPAREHARQLVRIGSAACAVLDIPGIAEDIRRRAGLAVPAKENK
jgi:chemotaxis signal transduction protein